MQASNDNDVISINVYVCIYMYIYIYIVKEGTYATHLDNVVTFFILFNDSLCT